jgi:hypothetical protein
MQQIGVDENSLVTIRSTRLAGGEFVKLQPHSKTFLEVSNPRAVYVVCIIDNAMTLLIMQSRYYQLTD